MVMLVKHTREPSLVHVPALPRNGCNALRGACQQLRRQFHPCLPQIGGYIDAVHRAEIVFQARFTHTITLGDFAHRKVAAQVLRQFFFQPFCQQGLGAGKVLATALRRQGMGVQIMQRPQHLQPHCAQRGRAFAAVELLPNQLQLARGSIGTAALASAAQGAQIQPKERQCFFRSPGKQRRKDVNFVPRIQAGWVIKIPLCHPGGHAAHAAVHIAVVVVGCAEFAPAIEAIV